MSPRAPRRRSPTGPTGLAARAHSSTPSKFLFPSGRPTACIDVEQFNAKGVQVIGVVVKVLVVEPPTEGAPEVASWFVGGPVGETVQIPAGQTCMINPSLLVEDAAADDEPRVMQLR
mmetsp:Transcript_2651/g.7782  ORF Transcript_2651/g.7782 Transcript_2651/m.7782 type:complete len:117 (+) Transcript_2651:3452-3802(+)